jgi:hypothetical protein
LEDAGLQGVKVRPQDLTFNDSPFEVDIVIEGKNVALKVIETVKIHHDLRFLRKRNMLEENRLMLLGDDKYTLSERII